VSTPVEIPVLAEHDLNLPSSLEGLGELAYNLWWSWTPRAGQIFGRIDSTAWSRHHNPIPVLRGTDAARWAELTADDDFMVDASRLLDEFHRYLAHHGFANETAAGPGRISRTQYDAVWAEHAWDRTLTFFGRTLWS